MNTTPKIAIIGAGLAGPTLALCLKKLHGTSCTIYELRPGPDDRGTNMSLTPNALRVMQHIGVYDQLRLQGYNYDEVVFSNGHGQQLTKYLNGSESVYNFRSLRIHRKRVQKVLLDEVSAQGIDVHYGMKLVRLTELGTSGLTLHFEDGSAVNADFVIGTDGIHSRVRPAVSSVSPVYSGFLGITGLLDRDRIHGSLNNHTLPNMFFGQSGFMAVMPSSFDGKEIGFFSTMESPERGRAEWEALFNNPEAIQKILTDRFTGDWTELIRHIATDVPSSTLASWPFYIVPPLEHYASSSGRVIVIGDAAHGITPQGGQGGAMAFEDADTLAITMSQLDFLEDPPKLLRKWEAHRQERMDQVRALTNRNASLRDPGRSYLRQVVKEYIVWAFYTYKGPTAGAEWLYGYNAENIVSVLRG